MAKFTYSLETDEEDDRIRGLQTIDHVHVRSEERGGWDGMIRLEVFKKVTKFTYGLDTDEEDGMG